jgi:cytochrome P450
MSRYVVELLQRVEEDSAGAQDGPGAPGGAGAGAAEQLEGPLARAIAQLSRSAGGGQAGFMNRYGNGLIFSFAGHMTTGATMSWLVFELSKRPDLQKRLQAEVDAMFAAAAAGGGAGAGGAGGGQALQYRDCRRLPFLTRCVMETLRLWPAVPTGTFRELQYDESVTANGGRQVTLPKGTYVQV